MSVLSLNAVRCVALRCGTAVNKLQGITGVVYAVIAGRCSCVVYAKKKEMRARANASKCPMYASDARTGDGDAAFLGCHPSWIITLPNSRRWSPAGQAAESAKHAVSFHASFQASDPVTLLRMIAGSHKISPWNLQPFTSRNTQRSVDLYCTRFAAAVAYPRFHSLWYQYR